MIKCDDYLFGLYKAKLEDGEEYIKISNFMKFAGNSPDLTLFPIADRWSVSLMDYDISQEGNENKMIPWSELPNEFNSMKN